MAVPAQLFGQVPDNRFDATELWQEPWGDERDPYLERPMTTRPRPPPGVRLANRKGRTSRAVGVSG